jgi:uncharacterized protein
MMDPMVEPETNAEPEPRIVDNADDHRYELWLDGTLAGFLEYTPRHRVVVLNHTEIDPAFEGRGLGSTLIAAAIKDIRARGLRLYPECPFVQAYLERHPEERDIALPVPDRKPE